MGRDLCIIIRLKFGAIYLISKLGLSLDLSISRSLDLSLSHVYETLYKNPHLPE